MHVLVYCAHIKRLHSVKWLGLYGDTATMQELLLKTCTSSAWRKRSLEWNCYWIVYGTGLQQSLALADLPLRKLWKRRRHKTSSNNQSNHRHLRRKCHWMTLTRVLYGGPSPACTPPTLDNIRTELKQSIGYTGSKGRLRKDLLHTKSAYTRCWVYQKVLIERQDVVLSRIRYIRMVRGLREAVYTDVTYVHTSHAVPKCWQDSTTGLKIPFSKGNLRIVELHDPWVCAIITIWVHPLVRPLAVPENAHSSWLHSIFWLHFACICHSLTTGMLNNFLWKRVSFKLANIQRWPCILLSVDFTLHKINLFIGSKYKRCFMFIWTNLKMQLLIYFSLYEVIIDFHHG